ncbi:histone H3-like centromeric protein cid [Drosophila hydei]|uniref:Histone H3-like centromeric protein cid n=1 Tax=Drosophila hydei TaxID=7224 RepID=A0A6J1LAI0_DROHY|nr:histone H3-like centromeric protein cid [Drosophila hydei]XP_023162986.1 histone H3-like centromeric protein cid [Drosophila hydei]
MRRSDTQNSDDSQAESDLSAAFGPGAMARCSTTRKQQNNVNEGEDINPEYPANPPTREALLPILPSSQPSPRPTPNPNRRKQMNPFRRAQKFRREVRQLQRSPNFMIPRLSFGRVVREIMLNKTHCEALSRITIGALEALQTATEMFLTQRFQDSYMMTMHRQRVTLELRDMALMAFICKQHGLL